MELPQLDESRTSILTPGPAPVTASVSPDPPQDSTLHEPSQGGLFVGKHFLLVGFGLEAVAQLSQLVEEHSGKLLVGRKRTVADYAVVPLLGCEVEATVDEVVTDTWLVRGWGNYKLNVFQCCSVIFFFTLIKNKHSYPFHPIVIHYFLHQDISYPLHP